MTDRFIQTDRHTVSNLFLFILIAVFALFSFLVAILGIRVYQKVTDMNDANAEMQSSVLYLSNKIRSADERSGVSVEHVSDTDLLVLSGYFESEEYELLIYCYDGAIRETIRRVGDAPDFAGGESIVSADGLLLEEDGDSIYFEVLTSSGAKHSMHIFLNSTRQADDE